ncbi:MAG: N-acetyltransferase family protein [Actinomycetota bacterium]
MRVRPGRESDADAVTALLVELRDFQAALQPGNPRFRVAGETWAEEARRTLSDPAWRVFVAEEDGRVVGFASLRFARKPWGTSCEVDSLVVADANRGRGIGRALMGACESHGRSAGAAGMRLHVTAGNDAAVNFYERLGYEALAVRMGKPLAE